MAQLAVLNDVDRLSVALPPLRRQLLALLAQPEAATSLARRLDLPRQKVNYHPRALERAGLVELVKERRRRGLVERRLRATARAWVIEPALLASGSVEATEFQDRFASAYLVAAAGSFVARAAALSRGLLANIPTVDDALLALGAQPTADGSQQLQQTLAGTTWKTTVGADSVRWKRADTT